jgi:hypothetical protein
MAKCFRNDGCLMLMILQNLQYLVRVCRGFNVKLPKHHFEQPLTHDRLYQWGRENKTHLTHSKTFLKN